MKLTRMKIDIQKLKAIQLDYAERVIRYDVLDFVTPTLIAGTDVGFEDGGAITRAAIAVLNYPDLTLLEYQVARLPTEFPYIPGYLSFREYPALVAAWKKLRCKPDLVIVDGQGIAHPRRLGIASHLGLLLDIPTIGVAKRRLCGTHQILSSEVGSSTPLMDDHERIGFVLQSKARCKPLYISLGHRISDTTALTWIQRLLRGYRLPEPTRWADAIASRKPLFNKWLIDQI
ncbi:deoxyribonuclease V [Candidatus Schmidhempelia bombi str. Bimp]|uniref:Endonuclease V n=1 Tax=Candidatus Schmidhempelia bombi str. Bimp TaxID=1387197 RepID=A0AB94IDS0_9GAMM|nr:deoxyribonuclease V [Candidatus Schmidhempelia bombi str. Bimp]